MEEKLKVARERLQKTEDQVKTYDNEKTEMFSQTKFSKTKLVVLDLKSLFVTKEQVDLQFQGMISTWERP